MATLLHLNGAPGVGKSTLAERYAADHPGTLNCDIDRLRCLIGGWADDFGASGAAIRPVALAMIRAHLDGGRDVVLPQMLGDERERARFRAAAVDGGHRYVHLLLQAPRGEAGARFYGRPDDALHRVIRGVIDADGGAAAIDELDRRLASRAAASDAVCVDVSGGPDAAYARLLAATR
jgi:predicted kinase